MADVAALAERYRRRLARREARLLAEMLSDWRAIEADLKARAIRIGELIEQAVRDGTPVSPAWLYQQERVESLLRQARLEMERLRETYAPTIAEQARLAAGDGARMAAEQLRVSVAFGNRLSVDAVEYIAASTRVGPVAELLGSLEELTGKQLRDALVRGVARGANPRAIAREVQRSLLLPRERALTIARTEVARAQRLASLRSYRSAGVTGWQWLSAQDSTTCAACWSFDGQVFPVEDVLDDHPNGRCTMVPYDDGTISLADVPDRDAAWRALPESDKRRVLGPSRYDAVKSGELSLGDLGRRVESPRWGSSIRVAPL